jgi:hypothetical protein
MAELSANITIPENPEEFVTWAYRQRDGRAYAMMSDVLIPF